MSVLYVAERLLVVATGCSKLQLRVSQKTVQNWDKLGEVKNKFTSHT